MFYGHAMFIGGGSRYLSFPVYRWSRPVDTKTDFNLNNIIATLSLISISSVKKKFAGKCPDKYSNLIDLNSARWMPKLVNIHSQSYPALTSESLRATISPANATIKDRMAIMLFKLTLPLRHRNLRNLTLQQECHLTNTRAFFRLRTAL